MDRTKFRHIIYTSIGILVIVLGSYFLFFPKNSATNQVPEDTESLDTNVNPDTLTSLLPPKDAEGGSLYRGRIYNIFFHSLVVYPNLAFNGKGSSYIFQNYMVTRDEFEKILSELYKRNFILVDTHSLYDFKEDGTIYKRPLYLPEGKKPLVISIDDLSYYSSMTGHGFADKLVIDSAGKISTEIITPDKQTQITRDGDIVPILDDFVTTHPDFSYKGAKGLIALTGFEGVLGYRTNATSSPTYVADLTSAKQVIDKLKETGWSFASHSYSHDTDFTSGKISLDDLKTDISLWNQYVRPLVGDTDIFVGPFGQIFKPHDPRRALLISSGFKVLCGVGMDSYYQFFSNYLALDRADIDGYRLIKTPRLLDAYFDPKTVIDPARAEHPLSPLPHEKTSSSSHHNLLLNR